MKTAVADRAAAAAMRLANESDLVADDAIVLWSTNKLSLRLLPCDVFARVGVTGEEVAALELEVARRLTAAGAPIAALDPRTEPRVYEADGFAVTFWTYYEQQGTPPVASADYAEALRALHAAMRDVEVATPHFMDRVAEAESLVADRELTPALNADDREVLADTLAEVRHVIEGRGTADQLLHGEPHPGNVLSTASGPRFVDFETCCRGPVEFDIAHGPVELAALYPDADTELVETFRRLILAMIGAWRWQKGDQFPNGLAHGRNIVKLLRQGPPWPALGSLVPSG